MHHWMQGFADHTAISWWIFVLSGLGMLLVATLASGFQTISAAMANPVKSLRGNYVDASRQYTKQMVLQFIRMP